MIVLLAEGLTLGLESSSQEFDLRFEKTLGLREKGFDDKQIYFSQTIMSNLIGGIGYLIIYFYSMKTPFKKKSFPLHRYFYGSSIVDRSFTESDEDENEFWTKYRQADPKLTPL